MFWVHGGCWLGGRAASKNGVNRSSNPVNTASFSVRPRNGPKNSRGRGFHLLKSKSRDLSERYRPPTLCNSILLLMNNMYDDVCMLKQSFKEKEPSGALRARSGKKNVGGYITESQSASWLVCPMLRPDLVYAQSTSTMWTSQ